MGAACSDYYNKPTAANQPTDVATASQGKVASSAPGSDPLAAQRREIALNIGDTIPDFEADTTTGHIRLHDFIGSSWVFLFSHPRDFTPVCTTELSEVARLMPFWEEHNVKVIALSCDDVDSHRKWLDDITAYSGVVVSYPIIADPTRDIAVKLGMLDHQEKDAAGIPLTVRKVFLIGPDKRIKVILSYPPILGRDFAEIKRIVVAMQLTAKLPVSTPVNWCPGKDVMILPSVSAEDAAAKFPGHTVHTLPSGKPYLRTTQDPSASLAAVGGTTSAPAPPAPVAESLPAPAPTVEPTPAAASSATTDPAPGSA